MNTSDIIAILAISVSALVTIIVAITSYRSNKLNIQARRSEMAFEKQIEAFREIADKLGGIRRTIVTDDRKSESDFFSHVEKATLEYHFTYQRYRMYLPSDLDAALREFTQKAISYYSNADYNRDTEFFEDFNKLEPKIIKIMNKHLGIN